MSFLSLCTVDSDDDHGCVDRRAGIVAGRYTLAAVSPGSVCNAELSTAFLSFWVGMKALLALLVVVAR